ncbi:MAG: monovalent cation/H(+) antiporter subunit G, partial [Ignisphaera sp.]
MISWILIIIGEILIAIGAICDLIAAIGMNRFPNFFVRLHALTVGTIGGAFVPLIGVAILVLGAE